MMMKMFRMQFFFCEIKKYRPNAKRIWCQDNKFDYDDQTAKTLQQKGFTQLFTNLPTNEQQKNAKTNFSKGRPWKAEQLRLKSTQDLNKLWYVCVREKNLLLADQVELAKMVHYKHPFGRKIQKVTKTMNRIMTVISEREKIKSNYKQMLQNQYIQHKKIQLQKEIAKKQPELPRITWELLRAKYSALRKGVDNIKYLEVIWDKKTEAEERKKRAEKRLQTLDMNQKFTSFWQKQMKLGERPTQEEILRNHVKNWKSLNLAQRRIILGFLNAKRSKDAKQTFIKQLKMLGKKVAYQQAQSRIQKNSQNIIHIKRSKSQ